MFQTSDPVPLGCVLFDQCVFFHIDKNLSRSRLSRIMEEHLC